MTLFFRLMIIFVFLLLLPHPLLSNTLNDIQKTRENGEFDLADNTAKRLLSTAKHADNLELEADALYQLGRNAMERNDYPQAHHWLEQAVNAYLAAGDNLTLAATYRQIGLTYRYQSNYSVALEYLYMSLAIYQSQGSKRDLASIHNSLGVVLEKMGQFNEAAAYHQQALEANYALEDQSGIASSLYNLGDIRRVMGDFELAFDYFKQALEIDEASDNKKNIAYSSYKVGYVNMQMGKFDIASEYMQRAYDLFTEIQAKRDIDWALSGLADLALRQGRLSEAESMASGIVERARANQYNSLFLDVNQTLIEIYISKEQFGKAQSLIDEAVVLAESMSEAHKVSQLLAHKVIVSEALEDIHTAHKALKKQKALDDKRFNQNRIDAIASTQAQTEFIRRANEIELLKRQQTLQGIQIQQAQENRIFIGLGLVVLLLCSFLLYSRRVQAKYTHTLEAQVLSRTAELQKANEELAVLSLTDKLTGLKNRRFFENQIDSDIASVLRKHQQASDNVPPDQADLCLFIVDLDKFKHINDTYGHTSGDNVIKQIAQRLQSIFRESDYVVRWGGEEFVAVSRNINRSDAQRLAKRIIDDIQVAPFQLNEDTSKTITVSVGFACFPFSAKYQSDNQFQTIFSAADHCLYAAKAAGRNTYVGALDINDATAFPLPSSIEALGALAEKELVTLCLDNQRNPH